MADFKWIISALERNTGKTNGKPDAVTAVHWRLAASDGEFTSEAYGSASLPEPSKDFVAYKDLTPETVTAWLEETLDVEKIRAALTDQLAELAKPKSVTDTPPWA